jgi:hypothetical protein
MFYKHLLHLISLESQTHISYVGTEQLLVSYSQLSDKGDWAN